MTFQLHRIAAAAGLLAAAVSASATTLTFEDLAPGATLTNQYAALGAVFSASPFSGPGSSTSTAPWAPNTSLSIVDIDNNNGAATGTPLLASGNILHSFNGWLTEEGDPNFRITFTTPVNSFSAVFVGVSADAGDSTIWAYNGATLLGTSSATQLGQSVVSYSAPMITSVIIRPGSFNDWVGIDNVTFTPVPEPTTYAMMALGVGLLALRRRAVR